jgi:signal transduction histidine kinase/CheY-like chemotaxis protein
MVEHDREIGSSEVGGSLATPALRAIRAGHSLFAACPLSCLDNQSPQTPPGVKLRIQILVLLLVFGLVPLLLSVFLNLPLVLERTAFIYQKAYLQNLRADFRDLDQHLASRHEMVRLLAKLPEPGLILGEHGADDPTDLARARYTGWINQILGDQRDIIQILFLGAQGKERFWLERDDKTLAWHPTAELPERPNEQFLEAGLRMQPGGVMVSRIRIDPLAGAEDPRQLMTLNLVSAIGGGPNEEPMGLVVVSIDVGGLAQFYRDTLWVNSTGSYLRPGQPISEEPEAFADFPGLAEIFAAGKLALWGDDQGEQLIWVPMFLTEDALPLWVGRSVDPSPIESFRNALIVRVLTVVLLMILVVMFMARWIAARAEHFGQVLAKGLGSVLRDGETVRFDWKGPREVKELGEQLTTLAETHAEHLRAAHAHTRELEQSYRYKSEFLANVSHELRTPLNSILLLSKMLADENAGLSDTHQRQAQVIHEAGRDLRTMIDNVLDISRIDAGQVAVNLEWIELRPLLKELIALVSPQFESKGLALLLNVGEQVPEQVYSDRDKLRQILKNFLSNAAKFTDRGSVALDVDCDGLARCPLVLSVTDTGIGIPADKQEVIFEAFQQADGSTRRRYGGTGLGLSISRELAELLGGKISVQSEEGKGSRFTLAVPVELDASHLDSDQVIHEGQPPPPAQDATVAPDSAEMPADDLPAERPFAGHWVLLIEREVRGLVAETALLESLGLRVQTAADADEALETLHEEGECALVLLATLMSAGNTCDTIRAIRDNEHYRQLQIVVMGAVADAPEQARFLTAGADGFVTKPVDRDGIAALLSARLGASPEQKQRQTA